MIYNATTLTGRLSCSTSRASGGRAWLFCARDVSGTNSPSVASSASSSRPTIRTIASAEPCAGCISRDAPHAEVKLVRCVQGAIHDVIVDLRPDSPAYMRVGRLRPQRRERPRCSMSLRASGTASSRLPTIRHVTYQVSYPYTPGAEGGLRYDDPAHRHRLAGAGRGHLGKDASWPAFVRRALTRTRADAAHVASED